jgi:DNA-binding NarL/FixJ family response regulator
MTRPPSPPHNEKIRVILADDHGLMREGLRLLLQMVPDIDIVGEAESGVSLLPLARRLAPDVVILDLEMPGGNGTVALRELGQTLPEVRVLVLTMYAERERLLPLLQAGAHGYLTKEAASRDLVDAVRVVAAGEIYVRPITARQLATAVVPQCATETAGTRFRTLSQREQRVVRSVAEGYSGAEIARQLGISTKTVNAYKHRIQDKIGLGHRTDYVRFAIEAGILGR